MRITIILLIAFLAAACMPALAIEGRAYKMREDMGTEPLYDGVLQYFYYIPCPTYAWFYAFGGIDDPWEPGTTIGKWFEVGDISMMGAEACDPALCHTLEQVRVLGLQGIEGYAGF